MLNEPTSPEPDAPCTCVEHPERWCFASACDGPVEYPKKPPKAEPDEASAALVERPVGSLCADDLGSTITIPDGGSVHRGTLTDVQHQTQMIPKTWVRLRGDNGWSIYQHWPQDHSVTVEQPPADHDTGREVGP